MARKRLLWQLYPSYVLVAVTSLVSVGWYAAYLLEKSYESQLDSRLQLATQLVERQAGSEISSQDADRLRPLCDAVASQTHANLAIVSPAGATVVQSGGEESTNAAPQIVPAAVAPRTGEKDLVVRLPVVRDGRELGTIIGWVPQAVVQQATRRLQITLVGAGLLITICAASFCLFVARQVSRPFEEIREVAERFARGDLAYKLAAGDSEEMTGLAGALNQMASQLQERLQTIVRQTSEQQAVLSSMVEGVLAIDAQQRVITLNEAAAELVGNTLTNPLGRNLHEVVRNPDLRRFADRVLASNKSVEDDVVLHGDPDRVLQIRGTSLRDPHNRDEIGAVIVMSDVTHFRRLETIRRDFVANVSHELKTPITSIKGFVETLLDGALSDPHDAERFLRIVATQADRLNAIIEDLLALSKIEQSERSADLKVEEVAIKDMLQAVLHDCQSKAAQREIQVRVECDDTLLAQINAPLLEQAVTNLLDNALKYSEPGSEVLITAVQRDAEVTIAVSDRGCGIDDEHLPRLFERFYRVDKARSRKLGGTGLGLAIVKHIVQAHQGRITVDSTPGVGSVFRIHLPLARIPREAATTTS
ncbi:MAG TPA: ATP-binding protein [Pirellulales bacterium]|jgi:two-component system phosphate regulon sensor histidine kinase PhoR